MSDAYISVLHWATGFAAALYPGSVIPVGTSWWMCDSINLAGIADAGYR